MYVIFMLIQYYVYVNELFFINIHLILPDQQERYPDRPARFFNPHGLNFQRLNLYFAPNFRITIS